jgi:hypothetical protein
MTTSLVQKYIQNGLYIPLIHAALFYYTNNLFLSCMIVFKLYPANYYYWFQSYYQYNNLPKWTGSLKQFTRFTDSGHLASLIYYFYPAFFPVAFNIHGLITIGYWGGIYFFNMKDQDDRNSPELIKSFENMWIYSNHLLPLLLFIRELWIQPELCSMDLFTIHDLYNSYFWLYCWFLFIYIPWRLITGDCIYSILSHETPIHKLSVFILFIHGIFVFLNMSGSALHYIHCYK